MLGEDSVIRVLRVDVAVYLEVVLPARLAST